MIIYLKTINHLFLFFTCSPPAPLSHCPPYPHPTSWPGLLSLWNRLTCDSPFVLLHLRQYAAFNWTTALERCRNCPSFLFDYPSSNSATTPLAVSILSPWQLVSRHYLVKKGAGCNGPLKGLGHTPYWTLHSHQTSTFLVQFPSVIGLRSSKSSRE